MSLGVAKSGHGQVGFGWWTFQGWMSLIVGTLVCLSQFEDLGGAAVVLLAANIGLSVMIIRYSRTAFIIGTVLSINPILWIVNWIYIKNRWHDPLVLENQGQKGSLELPTRSADEITEPARFVAKVPLPLKAVTPSVLPPQAADQDSSSPEAGMPSDEVLWEKAMQEADSPIRRQGLWAKCFGEAHGVDSAAKAAYMTARVEEMKIEIRAVQQERDARRRTDEQKQRLAHLDEAQRAYERLPKGTCPNCSATIPVASVLCPKCQAHFGPGSAWNVQPLA